MYIEREALLKHCNDQPGKMISDISIAMFPAADVAPVVHGEWVEKPTGRYGQWQSWCSACGKHSGIGGIESNRHKPYCPNCGAKMK